MEQLTILGSTGSIGVSTLDVVARHPQRYRVFALTAHSQWERLLEQCRRFRPTVAVMVDAGAAAQLRGALADEGLAIEVLQGDAALEEVAAHGEVSVVMAAIVGAAGLKSALAAALAGKRLLLANKEALVISGALLLDAVRRSGATLLPIDSEHNAIFQSLPWQRQGCGALQPEAQGVRKILLTASGGPFREFSAEALAKVTPEEAVAHPNWSMGRKISVDSASMMNKGLEVIEACWLFNLSPDQIEVVVHPQSIIHSLVEYVDGSVLSQMGNPDMRTPIAHALAWPERIASGVPSLDLFAVARLDFEPADEIRFPALALSFAAMRAGGTAPALLNAANEVAVEQFLLGAIPFTTIPKVIAAVLDTVPAVAVESLEQLLEVDGEARRQAERWLQR
ncbi:MAG: 1-deoxy-D-xylulose-5-phosphate reductoisomerase [Gammaproteobacteria bacterium]|nr:1-deoxy-D-xylulose-5-phosphate reductoisomerase [Gammaproteobacteria bacterium]